MWSSNEDFPTLGVLQEAAMLVLEGQEKAEISSHFKHHFGEAASVSCKQSTDMKELVVSVTTLTLTYLLEIRGTVALPQIDPANE
jgi:hypothetical protein